jgi:peptidoglycan/LPS O-acetylase OafA/YrhL
MIPSFTDFTFLFMVISAFSRCCRYYEKFKDAKIDTEHFYKRRYQRLWLFFAILCTIALVMSISVKSFFDWFADLTLMFGLIPNNNIEIIGVGWFIGLVFVFYMMFPFFVFAIGNKKRAWFSFTVGVLLTISCILHFTKAASRINIVYSASFFLLGGIVYLYRDVIKRYRALWIALLGASIIAYYTLSGNALVGVFMELAVSYYLLATAISLKGGGTASQQVCSLLQWDSHGSQPQPQGCFPCSPEIAHDKFIGKWRGIILCNSVLYTGGGGYHFSDIKETC